MPKSMTERLGLIVEDSMSEIYVFSAESYRFELVNRGARENLGYTMDELRGLMPWDLKPEFTEETFVQMVEPLHKGTMHVLTFETLHRRKDGSLYDVSVKLQLIPGEQRVFYAAIEDITERKKVTAELSKTNNRLDAILNNTRMAVFMMDERQHCVYMNAAAEELTGFSLAETIGRRLHDVIHHTYPDGRPFPLEECAIDRAFPENSQMEGEDVFVHKDGRFYPVAFTASPICDDSGQPVGTVIEVRSIEEDLRTREAMHAFNETLQKRVADAVAEQRKTELQLAQAQKMEAVGKLTGGVAHDFNNLLQVIGGNIQLLKREVAGNERAEKLLQNALVGVTRGAKLASQLLSFGRRQPLEPRPIDLGRVIRNLDDMLRRTLGEEIEIETVVAGGLWNCLADATQVENAILNLAINSRDAMRGRGKLTIEAGNAWLDDEYVAKHADVTAGQYVMLAVTDTGSGIPPEILEHIFEPFFTTKPEGEGSGLGLSGVYGFAKQSGGHVKIYSEVRQGTTVRLYLPRTRRPEDSMPDGVVQEVSGGVETILVVEDDTAVRTTAAAMLTELGYEVLKAKDADSALAIIESGVAIDLLFTDVVMQGTLRSTELTDHFRRRSPRGAVLYTSGYTQNAIVHAGRLDDEVELLSKPYSREALARKVRQVLDATSSNAKARDEHEAETSGQRSVLIVEDEVLIRINTVDMLTELDLHVSEAATAQEARILLGRRPFDLLITDVGLPDGSGLELAREALARHPGLRVVLASGQVMEPFEQLPQAFWLPKPYDQGALAAAVGACSSQRG